MVTSKDACALAQGFDGVSEKDHFGSDAFYANKKIFATVWHDKNQVNVRLTPALQKSFVEQDEDAFLAIHNAWGRQGWTTIKLESVAKKQLSAALKAAWETTALKVSRSSASSKVSVRRKAVRKKKT